MDGMKHLNFADLDLYRIGNDLEIVGVVYGNEDENILIALPGEGFIIPTSILMPTVDEWTSLIRQSDLKEIESKAQKIILRKSSRQIDQRIMWDVFRRDNFTCRYCGADDVPMTVDHVVTWEEGGPSIPRNLITSCKKCNNRRGNMDYEDWLKSPYYLSKVPSLHENVLSENSRVIEDIPYIRENLLQPIKKSR